MKAKIKLCPPEKIINYDYWVLVPEEMAEDAHQYGYGEVFCMAEQFEAIRRSLS